MFFEDWGDPLKEVHFGSSKGDRYAWSPIEQNHKLGEAQENVVVECGMYQCLVRKLIYLSHTRPDIPYVVSVVSQFMHSLRELHLEVVYKILHYMKSTLRKGIVFKKNEELSLEAYTDADWALVVDRCSTSSYCTLSGGNLVTWRSKKQSMVAQFSAKVEFIYGTWDLWAIMDKDYPWWSKNQVGKDNEVILWQQINNHYCSLSRTAWPNEAWEVDQHFIKEKLNSGLIYTSYVSTKGQLANVLIKGLANHQFQKITCKLGMDNIYSPTWEEVLVDS